MLPGAVTPLTFSTFGRYLDIAMRGFYGEPLPAIIKENREKREAEQQHAVRTALRSGVPKDAAMRKQEGYTYRFVGMFSGHLFLNLTQLYSVVRNLLGGS